MLEQTMENLKSIWLLNERIRSVYTCISFGLAMGPAFALGSSRDQVGLVLNSGQLQYKKKKKLISITAVLVQVDKVVEHKPL